MSQAIPVQIGAPSTGDGDLHRGNGVRWFWLVVAVATIVGAFVLPMAFPTPTFLRSASYMVGFNNFVSCVAVIGISMGATAWLVWKGMGARVSAYTEGQAMPLQWLGVAAAYVATLTGVMGAYAASADVNVGYWQMQIFRWSHDHARLYRDIEFAYGPILFYWPAYLEKLLSHAGVSPVAGYMLAEGSLQVLGIGILFYLVQQMPLSRRLKGVALAAITFGTITPQLGSNYSMFRFAIACAALLWIAKHKSLVVQAVLLAVAEAVMLGISPEVGIAFAGGAMAYALYRGVVAGRRWLWLMPVPAMAFGTFALLVDKHYFFTMSNFSKGLLAEIVEPLPNIDIFLFCAVVLCPLAIAGYMRRYGRDAGPMVGVYIVALAMVPSALGRCDELHVYFSWVGIFVVSLIGIDAYRNGWAKLALGLMLGLVLWTQAGMMYQYGILLKSVLVQRPGAGGFDLARLEEMTGGERVYLPIGAPGFVADALQANRQMEPSYFYYMMNAETVPGLERKAAEMRQAKFVLMPAFSQKYWLTSRPNNNLRYRIFRLGYAYPIRRPLFDSVAIVTAELNEEYEPIAVFGSEREPYTLYRRKGTGQSKIP
jgi:hypothetical protein